NLSKVRVICWRLPLSSRPMSTTSRYLTVPSFHSILRIGSLTWLFSSLAGFSLRIDALPLHRFPMHTSLREHASEVKAVRQRAVRRPRAAMGAPADLGDERRRSDVSRTGVEGAGHVDQRAYPTLARASISAPDRARTRVPPDPHRSGTAD